MRPKTVRDLFQIVGSRPFIFEIITGIPVQGQLSPTATPQLVKIIHPNEGVPKGSPMWLSDDIAPDLKLVDWFELDEGDEVASVTETFIFTPPSAIEYMMIEVNPLDATKNPCSCDKYLVFREGCKCGGV